MKENIKNHTSKAKEYFLEKVSFCAQPKELNNMIKDNIKDINIIDVRTYDEYIDGHIPFAVHIPMHDLEGHLAMLHKDMINIIYCHCNYCNYAYHAAYFFASKGYPVMVLNGGIKVWKELEYDIVKTSV